MAQDVAVVAGQSWAEKPTGTVWQLQAIVQDRAHLARWEPTSSGEPQLLQRRVRVQELEARAGWRPATPDEVEAARYDVENAKGRATAAVGEPRPSYQEAMRGLREVRQFLLTRGKSLVDELTQLAESSEGYISEAFGTRFTAYLCEECGHVVAEDTLREARGGVGWPNQIGVTMKDEDGTAWDGLPPTCFRHGAGLRDLPDTDDLEAMDAHIQDVVADERPMRRIVARVTADSPAPDALEGG